MEKPLSIMYAGFINTPSRIMFYDYKSQLISYYSKADGKAYVFCFDPLCNHRNAGCTAKSMRTAGGFCYCKGDNRFYYANTIGFADKVYSSAFDGTDKKLIFELEDFSQETAREYNISSEICTYGKYVYMRCQDSDKRFYYIYDTSSKKTFKADAIQNTGIKYFYKGEIYFSVNDKCYSSDPYLSNVKETDQMPTSFYTSYIYEKILFGKRKIESQSSETKMIFSSYNIETGEYTDFSDEANEKISLIIGVYKGDPICISKETFSIGKDEKGREVKTYKLYRISMKDGSISIFSDNLYYVPYPNGENCCIWFDGDTVLMSGKKYFKDEDGFIVYDDYTITGTVGEDGRVSGLKEATIY